jgi:hypothetical protein
MGSSIVLLGDSIFDNSYYVARGQSVSDHLARLLPKEMMPRLLAVDGSVTSDVLKQLDNLPKDATHVFVSSGGNDALVAKYNLFPQPGVVVRNSLEQLAVFQAEFRYDYSRLTDRLQKLKLPISVCTIYDSIPGLEAIHKTALSTFNDVIVLEAAKRRFSLIDLRLLCNELSDFSTVSSIEPSEQGGLKIAKAIAEKIGRGMSV